jgi:hypothetical protein
MNWPDMLPELTDLAKDRSMPGPDVAKGTEDVNRAKRAGGKTEGIEVEID